MVTKKIELRSSLVLPAPEGCSEPCQTSNMKRFGKIAYGFQPLTIFAKRSILDVLNTPPSPYPAAKNHSLHHT